MAGLLCLALAGACSSGGGSAPPPPPGTVPPVTPMPPTTPEPPPPEPPPFPRTTSDPAGFNFPAFTDEQFAAAKRPFEQSREYRISYTRGATPGTDESLGLINAAAAYARGATGAGETVVFGDSGFYPDHRELSANGKFTLVASFGAECTLEEIRLRTCADADHGTATAAVAAGTRHNPGATGGLDMHGVAFDANIRGIRLRLGAGGRTRLRLLPSLSGYDDSDDAAFYERLLYQPVDASLPVSERTYDRNRPWGFVFNLSFGTAHGIASFSREQIRAAFPRLAALFAQAHRPAADRSIIVWAAGNEVGENYDRDYDGDGELDTCGGIAPGELCDPPSPGAEQFREEVDAGAPVDSSAPTMTTALGVHFPELVGHVLTVVAVQQDGHIAGFSNRCGVARDFCLAAPGVGIVGPQMGLGGTNSQGGTVFPTNSYRAWQGTSFAAPMVTGALAVMRSFFKNPDGSYALGNTELVTRLLATADRTNYNADGSGGPDYSDSATYGQGLLDLDAATRPVGRLSTAMHGAGEPSGMGLDTVGVAFGAGLAQRLGATKVALYDELNAPFFRPAAQWLRNPELRGGGRDTGVFRAGVQDGAAGFAFAARRVLGANVRGLAARSAPGAPRQWLEGALFTFGSGSSSWWAGWNTAALEGAPFGPGADGLGAVDAFGGAHSAPFFSFVGDGPGAGFSRSIGGGRIALRVQRGAPLADGRALGAAWKSGAGADLRWRPGKMPLALHIGIVRERDGFLGTRATGAMGRAKSTTAFAGVGANWRMGNWLGSASAFFGATDPQTAPGWLRGVSALRSDAFALSATRRGLWQRDDRFTLRLAQPLRVRSGEALFRFAAGRTRYGEMLYEDHRIALRPQGRAMEVSAAWQGQLRGGQLRLGLRATRHPGHNAAAGFAGGGWVSYRRQF